MGTTTRRPATPGQGTRRPRTEIDAYDPWTGATDAVMAAARGFRDPVALQAMAVPSGAAKFLDAVAAAFAIMGSESVDTVAIDPKVIGIYDAVAGLIRKTAAEVHDSAAALHRAHQPRIERILDPPRGEHKWDLSVHEGRGFSGQRRGRRRG
jgi:predicted RNA methylase